MPAASFAQITDRDHVLGPAHAELTLIEYGDYQCPFCRTANDTVKAVLPRFGTQLRYVYRHFPLSQIHEHAVLAAEVAEAAGAQDRFWEMHDQIFAHQGALDRDALLHRAELLGLDRKRIASELRSHIHIPRIRADFTGGVAAEVNGTPTLFVNGVRHDGAADELSIVAALERARVRSLRPPATVLWR